MRINDLRERVVGTRLAVFLALGLFIVLGPLVGQVLDFPGVWVRRWAMFSEVGVGVLKGEFRAEFRDGSRAVLTPLEVLGLKRYPPVLSMRFPALVRDERDLQFFAQGFCRRKPIRVDFRGWTGTRDGWRALAVDDVCAGAAGATR